MSRTPEEQEDYLNQGRFANHGRFAEKRAWRGPNDVAVLLFGVFLPLCAIAVEWHWRLYGSVLMEIVWPYNVAGFALLIPVLNAVVFWSLKQGREPKNFIFRLAGVVLGISGLYALVILPLVPIFGLFAIGILKLAGIGLFIIGLAPLGAFLIPFFLRRRLTQNYPSKKSLVWQGLFLMLPLYLLVSSPETLVKVGLRLAQSPQHHDLGVNLLRRFGNSHDMIRAGCGGAPNLVDIWNIPLRLITPLSERSARKTYEEVTGQSYEQSAKQDEAARCTESMGKVRPPAN